MAQADRSALRRGTDIDGYRIVRKIADGGFGITYLARQLSFERQVAIKEYLPRELAARGKDRITVEPKSAEDRDDFEAGLAQFRAEGQTLVSFEHPNIVTAHDFREANGTAYLVMQHVPGKSLKDLLAERGPLPEAKLREILEPLMTGIEAVHDAGFLHRDIKPENIIVRADCTPVLVDFGAARCARDKQDDDEAVALTPGYAPHEQYFANGAQGPWTDIYALGATLYTAISGLVPSDATRRARGDNYVSATKVARGEYSPSLVAAIDAALAIRPEDRPQSIQDFRDILESDYEQGATITPKHVDDEEDEIAPAHTLPRQPRAWMRGAIAAVMLAALGGTGYWGWQQYEAAQEYRMTAEELQRRAEAEARARQAAAEARQEEGRLLRYAAELKRQAEERARAKAIREAQIRAAEARRRAEAQRQEDAQAQRLAAELRRAEDARRRAAQAQRQQAQRSDGGNPLKSLGKFFGSLLPR